jgi:ABC-type glycerol-3-phosphate transport system substrate-binding protein
MKKMKKLMALGLAGVMALSLAACGSGSGSAGSDSAATSDGAASGAAASAPAASGETRIINIGSWWRQYYASGDVQEDSADWVNAQYADGDTDAQKAEKAVNQEVAQRKWDLVPVLENKYNCKYYWQNLTYAGTTESLQNSTLAGTPDCDIYMVDTGMAIPAQANGLLLDLKTVLPEDHDLFTTQTVFSYLDLGDGKACILHVQGGLSNTYPLGFNMQMLEENNLEDPRDLYARGEWTWDKFIEYCKVLTQDTDGDGQLDQYGFCGYANDVFSQLLMSNGATIAAGTQEGLSSAPTGEALQMLADMYNTYNVCYPYDSAAAGGNPSDSMRNQYNNGNIAFFPIAVWIQNGNGNYPMDQNGQGNLTWDTAYVQWPVGPSGNQETNACVNSADGNWFVIPVNVQDPATVVNFLYDLYNWFDGDTSLRDDPATANWWYNETANKEELKAANFEVQNYCLSHSGVELWDKLGVDMDLESIVLGESTPAQFQTTYAQEVQAALDAMF